MKRYIKKNNEWRTKASLVYFWGLQHTDLHFAVEGMDNKNAVSALAAGQLALFQLDTHFKN